MSPNPKDTTDSIKLQFVTELERQLYIGLSECLDRLKSVEEGRRPDNDLDVRYYPAIYAAIDYGDFALSEAYRTRTPVDIMSDDEGEQS